MALHVEGSFFVPPGHPGLTARIIVNGTELAGWQPTPANARVDATFALPPSVLAANPDDLRVELFVDRPMSPESLGLSDDQRSLGFGLSSLKLVRGEAVSR